MPERGWQVAHGRYVYPIVAAAPAARRPTQAQPKDVSIEEYLCHTTSNHEP